nr:hypothetical protein [Tanacetum cinerariifolium]
SSYVEEMIELRVNVELKDTIVVAMPRRFCKNSANINGKKKQAELSRQEVSNSNSFNALNYVENDDELGMNGEDSKTTGKGSLNLAPRCSSTTSAEQIDKLQRKILDGNRMFVDDDGKPLYEVDSTGIADRDNKVEEVFNETTCYMASTSLKRGSDGGYGTTSLLEQWRETKRDDNYGPYDPYYDPYESMICLRNFRLF